MSVRRSKKPIVLQYSSWRMKARWANQIAALRILKLFARKKLNFFDQ